MGEADCAVMQYCAKEQWLGDLGNYNRRILRGRYSECQGVGGFKKLKNVLLNPSFI